GENGDRHVAVLRASPRFRLRSPVSYTLSGSGAGGAGRRWRVAGGDRLADPEADPQQGRQVVEPQRIGAVGEGLLGPGVNLQEEGIAPGGDRRAGEVGDHL